ncbi:phosphate ABC transporter substrate-binding protein PstS [Isoptericola sp. b490]|uniref:phosphate ABC transporter substrate-binding protein PstS n=1 Tax=Actinotalea lenta TaxID=3064654 RepID=UPI0027144339|nr:phosphate ABC transporter substrate-binding protein PstS [Isoptericola sp. b490]MDO8121668.1 phosphate ABC transporter substrate-binding protein PstS [Isoptericola sp. b490]
MKLNRHSRMAGAAAVMGALALTLAACGSDNNTTPGASGSSVDTSASASGGTSLSGELVGAGSSAQEKAMDAWRAGFQNANPDVTVSYDPIGSGGGRTKFISGATDFAGSDAALSGDEISKADARCAPGTAMDLPVYISPIAIVYNLPSVKDLQLSPDTIAKIFDNKITTWDDPAIKADNPDATLPSDPIVMVHRSDESGTTHNFTDYLAQAAPDAWPYKASGDWPNNGGQSAQGTSGIIQTVQGAKGTISYADASQAGSLGVAKVKVGDTYVAYTADAAAAVVADSPRDTSRAAGDIVVNIDRKTTDPTHYPIVLLSYQIACTSYQDQATADKVKAWLTWVSSSEGQQAGSQASGSAPISDALRADIQKSIDMISAG